MVDQNKNSVIRVLFDEALIARRIDELAVAIKARESQNLLVVAVLKGSFMFAADMLRAMHRIGMAPQAEFIHLSSYKSGTSSTGKVEILRDIDSPVQGRDVLIVDDILESGRTLTFARDLIMARGARSADVCVLLEKPGKRAVQIEAHHVGFICPDLFVVGYGMDVAHAWRQLPYVGVIERKADHNQLEMM
jgi:hypoxanthine phosphoribosyltransferase